MKKLLIILLITSNAYADCDFRTDVVKTAQGYMYSSACHIRVGELVEENKIQAQKLTLLGKSIELKDLALDAQEKRVQLWMNTSTQLEDRVNTIERYNDTNKLIWMGLGIIITGIAVGIAK